MRAVRLQARYTAAPPGRPDARPGRGARARRLAGAQPPHHDRHVPRLLDLPGTAGLAGPDARRHPHHGAAGPGRRRADLRAARPRARDRRRARRDRATAAARRDQLRPRRLLATPTAAWRCSDFDLHVAPGETVALVGPSGLGQVDRPDARLALLRRERAESVRVDGHDVRDVTRASLRRQIGVVFEESFLFSDIGALEHRLRPSRTRPTPRSRPPPERRARTSSSSSSRTGTRRSSASGGSRCPAASASASRSPGLSCTNPASSSSTTPRAPSTPRSKRPSTPPSATSCAAARRCSSPTAAPASTSPTASSSSTAATSSTRAPTRSYSSAARSTARCRRAMEPEADVASAARPARRDPGHDSGAPAARRPARAPRVAGGPDRAGAPTCRAHARRLPASRARARARRNGRQRSGRLALEPCADAGAPRKSGGAAAGPGRCRKSTSNRRPRRDPTFSLWRFLNRFRGALGLGLLLVLFDTLASLAGPVLVQDGIDNGVVAGSRSALFVASALYLAVALADLVDSVAETFVTGRTAERLMLALRIRIWAKLQGLSLDYYEREMAGRIMTRMTTDVDSFETLLETGPHLRRRQHLHLRRRRDRLVLPELRARARAPSGSSCRSSPRRSSSGAGLPGPTSSPGTASRR